MAERPWVDRLTSEGASLRGRPTLARTADGAGPIPAGRTRQTMKKNKGQVRFNTLRVDPAAGTITPALDSFESAREWIGADLLECVRCGSGVDCWIDEEGMLRDGADHWILGGDQLLAGRAVFAGTEAGEWRDLPIPAGVVAAAVGWIPKAFKGRAQEIADGMRPVAVPWNDEGMRQLEKMNRERAGQIELLAVAAVPAQEAIGLGDFVTCPDGLTGFVDGIDGAVLSVRMPDGVRRYRADEVVKVEEID